MSILIYSLRPYYNSKKKQIILSDEYKHKKAKTVDSLFANVDKILSDIPEQNRFNLFWTAAHCDVNKRKFISQDVVPFDIDGIHLPEKENYLKPIGEALNVDLKKCALIWTGNGLQIIIKLKHPFTNESFFKTNRESYGEYCANINRALETEGLPGRADPSVFSAARLLRLPNTTNIKPMLYTNPQVVTASGVTPIELNIKQSTLLNGVMEAIDFPFHAVEKVETVKDYGRPDHETINKECLFIKGCLDGSVDVHEPECYSFLGVVGFYDDDDKTAWLGLNSFSSPTIDTMDKDKKLTQAKSASGPRTCKNIGATFDCSKCPHLGKIKSPIQIKGANFFLTELAQNVATKTPKEMQVVYKLLKLFDIEFDPETGDVDASNSALIQQYDELFHYDGKQWTMLPEKTINGIKRTIGRIYKYEASNNKIDTTYRHFLKFIPHPPEEVNLFASPHGKINFTNGTLHVEREMGSNHFNVSFKDHARTDYMTNMIKLRYDPDMIEQNKDFLDMLDRLFKDDPDAKQKIVALQEMFGASIMPLFPRMFFLHGVPGSGKSTLCIILSHLLDQENMCAVQLSDFNGFQMESMAGKLVNMVTDIKTNAVIDDDVVKQIEDRMPHRIQRKNRQDVYAPLPSVHIFGANSLPHTFEGATRAHDRRWTLIQFNRPQVKKSASGQMEYVRDYGNIIFESCPQGVLNFALAGLFRLLKKNGMFTLPPSGRAALDEWQSENDPIALFIEDVRDEPDRYKLEMRTGSYCTRSVVWERFQMWLKDVGRDRSRVTRNKFYKNFVNQTSVTVAKYDGLIKFRGIKDLDSGF